VTCITLASKKGGLRRSARADKWWRARPDPVRALADWNCCMHIVESWADGIKQGRTLRPSPNRRHETVMEGFAFRAERRVTAYYYWWDAEFGPGFIKL
jgi:hypothetical protein